ncbi:MAG TPA: nucleoside hydrolase [Acidimicrobiales bacterium]|nr:nucleoside hydrolase [Acidimicrobiales bacterium]
MRIHVDTDFAGDTDDACAVAFVLGAGGVELTGITTVADPDGRRAGYLDHFLRLAGRVVETAAGAGRSLTTGGEMGGLPDHATYWGSADVPPRPGPVGAAVELLAASVEAGATIVAIGPYTNLGLLEAARPGLLATASVVLMGGWTTPPRPGLPQWGPDKDWNVQCDTAAAATVFREAGEVTLVMLPATLDAHLRRRDLDRLAVGGPVGRLLARQAAAHGDEHDMGALGRAHPGLPDDLLNFQYDAAACAVAAEMGVATLEELVLAPTIDGGVLRFEERPDGRPARVTTAIDGDALGEAWLASVERLG